MIPSNSSLTNSTHYPVEPDYKRAVECLAQGEIVAFPTETFYGLAVDPTNEEALAALFSLKQRPLDKPFPILIQNEEQLTGLTSAIPDAYKLLMKVFWPGPLTLVFPAVDGLSPLLTRKSGGIGIRISPHPVAIKFGRLWKGPMTATSANISGRSAARTAEDVRHFFGDKVACILDGGQTPGGMSSTVLGFDDGKLQLLREGAIAFSELNQAIGQ